MSAKRQSFEDLDMTKTINILIKNGNNFTQTSVNFVETNAYIKDLQAKIDVVAKLLSTGDMSVTVLHNILNFTMELHKLNSFLYLQIITPRPNKDLSRVVLLIKAKYNTILSSMLESMEELLEAEIINEGVYLEQVNEVKTLFDVQLFDEIEALNSSSKIIIANNEIRVHDDGNRFYVEIVGTQASCA